MKKLIAKKIIAGVLSVMSVCVLPQAANADSHRDGWHHDNDWHGGRHYVRPHNSFEFIYVNPAPRYYAPRRTVVFEQPILVQSATPVYYSAEQNGYCREYTGNINVGGRIEQGHGTACQQPDGSWQIID